MHLHPIGMLSGWIEEGVKVESPVHFDEVARRMGEAAGITRIGSRIRECLKEASEFAERNGRIRIQHPFLWFCEMQTPVMRDRRDLPPAAKRIKYIAPEEVDLAIEKVVRDSIAIQPDAAAAFVARIFGFARMTEEMKADLLELIQDSIDRRIVMQEGGVLRKIEAI